MTLTKAMQEGANIVVIGRPITHAEDPALAAQAFAEEFWVFDEK